MKIEISPSIANFLVSWKTSILGFAAFCAVNGPQLLAYMQDHKEINGPIFWFGFFVFIMGLVARDGDKSSEKTGAKPAEIPVEFKREDDLRIPPISFLIAGVCIFMLTGCETATPNRKKAEMAAFLAYEQAHKNDSASYEKMKAANLANYTRKKDLELKADLQTLEVQSKLDVTKWTSQAIAAESARLQSLHDTQIAAYKERIGQADAIRAKNEQVNLGAARQIGSKLNPPNAPPEIIDQTKEIEAGAGAVPQPPPLIEVK